MQVGVDQGSVMSPLISSIAVDIITQNAREGLINDISYVHDLISMSENMENLGKQFLKWKEAFESRVLTVNLKKTKVIISDLKGVIFKSRVNSSGKKVMANSVLCTKFGKSVHEDA